MGAPCRKRLCGYIGLDLSLKETAISVRRGGQQIWRVKCPSDPAAIAAVLRRHTPEAKLVVFETGPLSVWIFHALSAEGLPALCIDARHAKAALDMAPDKTDANDAGDLAHLAEITATSFTTAIEDSVNFRNSRSVGDWISLTTRRYQSGEVDYDGHISRRGDAHLRGLLYEASTVVLTRTSAECARRTWGLKLRERIGFKRAAIALTRKLAVIMHAMLKSGKPFNREAEAMSRSEPTRVSILTR